MKFYKALKPIEAISFDLDDTLYDNRPVIIEALKAVERFLQGRFGIVSPARAYVPIRREVLTTFDTKGDTNFIRHQSVKTLLLEHGLPLAQAITGADEAMAVFLSARNWVIPPLATHQTLALLSKQYPLVAITNGNVNLQAIGLASYFDAVYAPGLLGDAKPAGDLFKVAMRELKLSDPSGLLHVGDHLVTDILGAVRCGAQSAWLPQGDDALSGPVVPNIQLKTLQDLEKLPALKP